MKTITEELAKDIAQQFFGFEVPCKQVEGICETEWWYACGNVFL